MHALYNKRTNALIGQIDDNQLQFLKDQMEEETLEDHDYSITNMELEYFQGLAVEPGLLSMLRSALGDAEELIIEWR